MFQGRKVESCFGDVSCEFYFWRRKKSSLPLSQVTGGECASTCQITTGTINSLFWYLKLNILLILLVLETEHTFDTFGT